MKQILSFFLSIVMLISAVILSSTVSLAENKHTHSFTEVTVSATCIAKGYTDAVCECGYSYRISETPRNNHIPSTDPKDIVTVPATCTDNGYVITYCANCTQPARTVFNFALGHDFALIKNEASCNEDGYEMKKCSRCDYETEKTIFRLKLDHKNPDGTSAYGEAFTAQKPTTNAVGYMGKECSLCGDIIIFEEIAKLPIMYGDCNMDGSINITDVIVLLQHIAKWPDLYISLDNSDAIKDGRINITDAIIILQYIAKWDVTLGR